MWNNDNNNEIIHKIKYKLMFLTIKETTSPINNKLIEWWKPIENVASKNINIKLFLKVKATKKMEAAAPALMPLTQ